jgi:high-affinity Fe2+/Pb2+ permease
MFSGLLHRAQVGVDRAIGQAVNWALVAVPFAVAAGFATASGYLRLADRFGSQDATLYVALGYLIAGVLLWLVLRAPAAVPQEAAVDAAPVSQQDAVASQEPLLGDSERELLLAALTSAAPVALPGVFRAISKNWALLIAILAAIFVMTRTGEDEAQPNTTP